MNPQELLALAKSRIAQRKFWQHIPYGHPDTLCPDGKIWKEKVITEGWEPWSNRPWQWEFHAAGKDHQERLSLCANRVGKTETAGFETTCHMTGEYPDWWEGKVFDEPVLVWAGSPTNETSRDIVQKALLGGTTEFDIGTGFIPKERIYGKPKMRQAGVSDVVDTFKVKHKSGGVSTCVMKTYEQGWRKWQGTEPEVVWLDEEPEDFKIYTEALTRLLTSHGIMMATLTPLLGNTDLVIHFRDGGEGVYTGMATWEDAPHLNRKERERLKASYPDHEVQARTQGLPMMGEGRIFTASEDDVICEPFHIPDYFAVINGIDFGIDHPFGLARIAWNRDEDIIYVYDSYKVTNQTPLFHAERIKAAGSWIPTAWPHDGAQRDKGSESGKRLFERYADYGVNMLGISACYDKAKQGKQPQWPIIEEIKERELTGRFKVFRTCHEYLEERRNYHTKDGKIFDKRDDVLKAAIYGLMMKRYAVTDNSNNRLRVSPSPMLSLVT